MTERPTRTHPEIDVNDAAKRRRLRRSQIIDIDFRMGCPETVPSKDFCAHRRATFPVSHFELGASFPSNKSRTAVTLLLTLLTTAPAHAAPNPLLEFLQRYRCPVADRLQRLYDAGDPAQDRDRFIVVSLLEHKHGYVQCRFHDTETSLLCEAASGFYYDRPGTPRTMRLPADKIAALARLGFSTDDSAGNFQLTLPVAKPPDFGAILRALYHAYGAGALTSTCDRWARQLRERIGVSPSLEGLC